MMSYCACPTQTAARLDDGPDGEGELAGAVWDDADGPGCAPNVLLVPPALGGVAVAALVERAAWLEPARSRVVDAPKPAKRSDFYLT